MITSPDRLTAAAQTLCLPSILDKKADKLYKPGRFSNLSINGKNELGDVHTFSGFIDRSRYWYNLAKDADIIPLRAPNSEGDKVEDKRIEGLVNTDLAAGEEAEKLIHVIFRVKNVLQEMAEGRPLADPEAKIYIKTLLSNPDPQKGGAFTQVAKFLRTRADFIGSYIPAQQEMGGQEGKIDDFIKGRAFKMPNSDPLHNNSDHDTWRAGLEKQAQELNITADCYDQLQAQYDKIIGPATQRQISK